MNRKNLLRIILVFFVFSKPGFAAPVDEIANSLLKEISNPKSKIAVIGFDATQSPAYDKLAGLLAERLTTAMVQTKKAEIIERRLLKKILDEKGLSMTGVMDSPAEAGKLLNVDYIVIGTLMEVNANTAELNARVVDASSGKIVSALSLELEVNETKDAIDKINYQDQTRADAALIQVAILLDTSNSMDGLIVQAKTQLWKIVNEMAAMKKNGKSPTIQIALYEYGNQNIPVTQGFTRQVLAFTPNMDKVSKELFSLSTKGGSEYAGYVLREAVEKLAWKNDKDTYKVIFIAGNEPFDQGEVRYEDSINKGLRKKIFINTIFCGSPSASEARLWKDAARLAKGMFLNIDQNREREVIASPYDDKIEQLGRELNSTYIPYGGSEAEKEKNEQITQDAMASQYKSSGASVERAVNKSAAQYSSVSFWDIVSNIENGNMKMEDIDPAKLPENYRKLPKKEIEKLIKQKLEERKKLQNEIQDLGKKRKDFQEAEARKKGNDQQNSLDMQMKEAIKAQAKELNYR